jgi:PAS domain S-box-containing protein
MPEHKNPKNIQYETHFLRALIADAPALMAVFTGPDHVFELVNRAFATTAGCDEADLLGKPILEAMPELCNRELPQLLDQVLRAGQPVTVPEMPGGPDGNRFFDYVFQRCEDATGTVRILVHAADVTDQVLARKKAEESAHRFRSLADSIPQIALIAGADGQVSWRNKRWYEYTGASPEDPASMDGRRFHDPEMLPVALDRWAESLKTGSPFEMELPLRGADGVFCWFLTRIIPMHDAAREVVQWFGTLTDVTNLKRIRDERALLLGREQEARASAELLNQIGPALLGELELEKVVQSVTDIATTLTGAEFGSFFYNLIDEKGGSYTLYTLSGVPREAFDNFPMPRNTAVFSATFEGRGVVRADDITQDPRYGKNPPHHGMPKGHLPVRSYLAAPVVSRSGEVLGGLFFGHSGTARFTGQHESIVIGIAAQAAIAIDNARFFEQSQWAQNELKRANEELRRANNDLETFAYSASHDLQEPLRNIAISAQLLQRAAGEQLDSEAGKFIDGILQGAYRMQNLIKDLMEYTQSTRYAEGPIDSVDANAVLAGVIGNLRTRIVECEAEVSTADRPAVCIREVHLAQLFQNLIGNALKYRGKEPPRVHVSAERQQGWWVFSVADNGIGFSPEYADQIFQLFTRLHSRTEYPGSGIGLAICQRIVEQYGGRIWVERSLPGAGSVFSFAIPER